MGLLGAHVSIAGTIENAVDRGTELQCEAIQIFSKNQRQWHAPEISQERAEAFVQAVALSEIKSVVIHDSYLINLANPEPEKRNHSRDAFLDEMQRAEQLSVPFLVFHPGSRMSASIQQGIQHVADCLNWVIDKQPLGKVSLLLETTAGQGGHLGKTFEELAEIIRRIDDQSRIGICFDTAHIHAAGYDIRDEDKYLETFKYLDKVIGLAKVRVFHLNDSLADWNSRKDRHAAIGKGTIGSEVFRRLVNDTRFIKCPMILEIPEDESGFKKNLKLLKDFRLESTLSSA